MLLLEVVVKDVVGFWHSSLLVFGTPATIVMLLFGGKLSGGTKKAAATKTSNSGLTQAEHESFGPSTRDGGNEAAVLTPHTDALHRLTNHELRLLEELERTRSKLQAEWRLKVATLQRQQPEVFSGTLNNIREGTIPGVEELEKRFQLAMNGSRPLPHNDLQHAMRSKTLKLSPNQRSKSFLRHKKAHAAPGPGNAASPVPSNVRTGLDMLPVLTTTGETPFEVGLESQVLPEQRQQEQPYVLPLFRLPSVNVVSTASAMAAKEVQAIKEDVDRKQASETLGLSVEEIEALEAELNGQSVSNTSSSSTMFYQHNQSPLDVQKLPGLAQSKSRRRQQQMKMSKRKSNSCSSQMKKGIHVAEGGSVLRKELESALYSVQHLTRLVKDDICWAQKICPASELRTTLYFKRWGREKVENIFRRLLYNLQGVAMERWKQAVAYEKQQEKLQAYLLYKGSKKLDMFLLNWSQRKLRQAWSKWWSDIVYEKALERSALQLNSIQVIQRSWRAYRGRMFAYLVKMQKLIAKQTTAAVKMQRMFRGELKLLALRERNRMYAQAAIKIQKMARKRQAIHRVERLRQERAARFVLQARTWVEYWNEDSAKWFYYNQETGEALWAPPATGYTKADGQLVLQDGNIIDPSDDDIATILAAQKNPPGLNSEGKSDAATKEHEEEEEEEEEDEDKLCVECEEEDARRQCAQCEDVFCDACYEKIHHSAKREKHTWKAIGSLRCIECEKMRATRWCSACEDPYCLGCFTIIHSKGSKATHQWVDMATFKKQRKQQQMTKEEESAQTYDEFVQSSEYQYVTEYAMAEAAREAREAQAYAQSYNQVYAMPAATTGDYGAWMTLVDEASGQTYYYNSLTGESRWA
ncbi:unnamed protein product [Phytophthora lilii]|uniref:Unnamed protein product n=1 Tax=Phytophthora lilii TaxID=2077276 RepID=A0A9W6WUX5_9STRA|nr:unnamed protein product [Phytophthora lilii]